MAELFFDTSALVRRYDRAEPGAPRVVRLCDPVSGNTIYIGQITPLEVASALNRKLRERRLTPEQRDRRWRLFRLDLRDQYRVLAFSSEVVRLAEGLLFRHPLRAFDAVQVASGLRLAATLTGVSVDLRFCTADRAQAQAARTEGLAADLIG